jgi:prepilin peptidase CpaA
MGTAALAGLIAGAIFFVFHIAGGMGGGDVKLITAVTCIAGLNRVTEILIVTALMGGLFAVAAALYHRRLKSTLSNMAVLAAHHGSKGLQPHSELNVENSNNIRLPYGMAIAAGTAISFCNVLMS